MMSANLISNPVVGEHKWLQSAADTVERPPCYKWRSSLTQHNQKTTIFLPFLSRCILSSVLPSLPSPSTNFFKLLKSCCFRVLYCEQLTLETALSVLLGFEAHRNNQKKIFLCLLPFLSSSYLFSPIGCCLDIISFILFFFPLILFPCTSAASPLLPFCFLFYVLG